MGDYIEEPIKDTKTRKSIKKAPEIDIVIINPEALPRAKKAMEQRSKELAQDFTEALTKKQVEEEKTK